MGLRFRGVLSGWVLAGLRDNVRLGNMEKANDLYLSLQGDEFLCNLRMFQSIMRAEEQVRTDANSSNSWFPSKRSMPRVSINAKVADMPYREHGTSMQELPARLLPSRISRNGAKLQSRLDYPRAYTPT